MWLKEVAVVVRLYEAITDKKIQSIKYCKSGVYPLHSV